MEWFYKLFFKEEFEVRAWVPVAYIGGLCGWIWVVIHFVRKYW